MSNMDHLLSIVTGLVTVFSAVSSFLNHVVRSRQAQGKPVAGALLGGAAISNVASINVDKAIQLVKMLRDTKAPAADADASK